MRGLMCALMLLCASGSVNAQNWSVDARNIALGGTGAGNLATSMIEEQRPYTSIVLPFGILQGPGSDAFNPDSITFDPVRVGEFIVSPLHFIVGRSTGNSQATLFVNDVRNGAVSRDLTKYTGFVPANEILAAGLAAPGFGRTIKFQKKKDGGFQGIYIGAGPYVSVSSLSTIDTGLTTVLSTGVNQRNSVFPIVEALEDQIALSVIGGYRARIAWPAGVGAGSEREGLYVAANYRYLHGFNYLHDDMTVRFMTDGSGLVGAGSNITIDHRQADRGTGAAVDLGVGAVIDRWEIGFGADGIANHINWKNVERKTFSLGSLTSGDGEFKESAPVELGDVRVELPIDYRGTLAYVADLWSVRAEASHGFGGAALHGGFERRVGRIELRGGGRYTSHTWNPTGGIGFDASRRVSVDVALFGTNANIERARQLAIGVSVRINSGKRASNAGALSIPTPPRPGSERPN